MEKLKSGAEQWNIILTDKQLNEFQAYYEVLVETNKVMNLTAITEKDEVIVKHFLDSLALAEVYPEIRKPDYCGNIIDVGTGAGFPGIPLKIAFPHLKILLLDSLNKRVNFLNSVIDRLKLCDISAIHSRAEEAARQTTYREAFDLCVSRAVANLSTLSEYCIPFIKKDGYFISYKSEKISEELNQARRAVGILGGKVDTVKSVMLPEEIERSFVFIRKAKETPNIYPRKAGTASKKPL